MIRTRVSDLCASVIVVLTICATDAAAQVHSQLNELGTQGAFETGRYTPGATEDQSVLQLKFYYGRFVTHRVSFGPALDLFKFEGSPATGSYGGFIDIHLGDRDRRVVPYIQGGAGQVLGSEAKPPYFQAGPGVKWFFGEGGGALNFNGVFRHQRFPEEVRNSSVTGFNDIVVSVGAAIFFGR